MPSRPDRRPVAAQKAAFPSSSKETILGLMSGSVSSSPRAARAAPQPAVEPHVAREKPQEQRRSPGGPQDRQRSDEPWSPRPAGSRARAPDEAGRREVSRQQAARPNGHRLARACHRASRCGFTVRRTQVRQRRLRQVGQAPRGPRGRRQRQPNPHQQPQRVPPPRRTSPPEQGLHGEDQPDQHRRLKTRAQQPPHPPARVLHEPAHLQSSRFSSRIFWSVSSSSRVSRALRTKWTSIGPAEPSNTRCRKDWLAARTVSWRLTAGE